MSAWDRVVRGIIGVTGGLQVLLGAVFWTGHALTLVPLHMVLGFVFVLALLALAVRSALAGAGWRISGLAAACAVVVLVFGMTQARILPGPYHWVIRVLHLLVGIAAMGFAGRLTQALGRARARRTAPDGLEAGVA